MKLGEHHKKVPAFAINDMRDEMRDLKNEKLATDTQIDTGRIFKTLNQVSLHHEFIYRLSSGIR